MPKVVVIIPSYNHAEFLSDCIASIQAQTFTDWQIVLVDDKSPDKSLEIARQLAESDPRIQVFENPENLGTYGTQARGLELSESEFVAVMNSDDLWDPQKLQLQVEQLQANPELALSYCLGSMVDDQGQQINSSDLHSDWPTTPIQNPLPNLLHSNRILASGVLWRREFVRFEKTCRYSGDWVALLEAATRANFGCITTPLTFWRQHDTNSYRLTPKQAAEEIRVRRAIQKQSEQLGANSSDKAAMKQNFSRNLRELSSLYAFFYQPKQARSALIQALKWTANDRTVIRRLTGSLMPIEKFRAHLWKMNAEKFNRSDVEPYINTWDDLHLRIK